MPPLYLIASDQKAWPMEDFQNNLTHWHKQTLEREGNEAVTQQIIHHQPDLILIDLNLKDLASFNLCATLRRHGMTIPILALIKFAPSLCSETIELTCHQAGITDWQYSPLNNAQWLSWLSLWLPSKQVNIDYIKRLN